MLTQDVLMKYGVTRPQVILPLWEMTFHVRPLTEVGFFKKGTTNFISSHILFHSQVLGFTPRQRRAFMDAIMRYGLPLEEVYKSQW